MERIVPFNLLSFVELLVTFALNAIKITSKILTADVHDDVKKINLTFSFDAMNDRASPRMKN